MFACEIPENWIGFKWKVLLLCTRISEFPLQNLDSTGLILGMMMQKMCVLTGPDKPSQVINYFYFFYLDLCHCFELTNQFRYERQILFSLSPLCRSYHVPNAYTNVIFLFISSKTILKSSSNYYFQLDMCWLLTITLAIFFFFFFSFCGSKSKWSSTEWRRINWSVFMMQTEPKSVTLPQFGHDSDKILLKSWMWFSFFDFLLSFFQLFLDFRSKELYSPRSQCTDNRSMFCFCGIAFVFVFVWYFSTDIVVFVESLNYNCSK